MMFPQFAMLDSGQWPLVVLAASVALLILLIRGMRLPPFFALVLAAFATGLLANSLPGVPEKSHLLQAIELTASELGIMAGKIAIVIALAAVIGVCLTESGAADKIVRRFLAWFGPARAGTALFLSSYFLSIPIFFDTFLILLLPLVRALARRTGGNYLLFLLAVAASAAVTHSLCAPHPGPLAMAEALNIDVGLSMLVGIVAGLPPALAGWAMARWLNPRVPVPLREPAGVPASEIERSLDRPESELPGLFWSALPVLLPLALIALASFADAIQRHPEVFTGITALAGGEAGFARVARWLEFLGNRNVALLSGAVAGMALLVRARKMTFAQAGNLFGPALEVAGVVILITSAGGAFGAMLKHAGVGDAVKAMVEGRDVNLILLAWAVAALIRVAQGSATVAMLTAAAMVSPMMADPATMGFHPMYVFMAIGFGAMILSWMNDSGFWVISKMGMLTEGETLRTWTVTVTVISIAGLVMCLLCGKLLPFAPQ